MQRLDREAGGPTQPLQTIGPPRLQPPVAEASGLRRLPQRLLGIALAVVLVALFFAISAAQVTGPTAGQRIQARAVMSLTELDDLLPRVYPTWRQEALTIAAPSLPVPTLPIPVAVPTADVLGLPLTELRSLVLTAAADQVYHEGLGVMATEETTQVGSFSPAGVVRRGLGLISDEMHDTFRLMALASTIVAAAVTALLLLLGRGLERLLVLGAAVLAAALPSLAAVAVLRFVLDRLADGQGDAFALALLNLGRDIMGIPIRNYVVFSLLGLALIAAAILLSRVQAAVERRWPPQPAVGEGDGIP
ncbi:MAG: hypothetical protein ACE5IZ_09040 [Dehalococcoidia bacterium]